jgi:DNA-binding PadR family transcriptional regulator
MKGRLPDPLTLLPLPGSEFQILLALADEERHGHGIKREVAFRTKGDVQPGPGTLYGSIKRMVASGLLDRPEPA